MRAPDGSGDDALDDAVGYGDEQTDEPADDRGPSCRGCGGLVLDGRGWCDDCRPTHNGRGR